MTIKENADSAFISGINFSGNISIPNNNSVDYLTIARCKVNDISFGSSNPPSTNFTIKENIVLGDFTLSSQYGTVSNNIFQGLFSGGQYNAILNNIFLHNGYYSIINYVENSMISNNIFFKTTGTYPVIWGSNNNTFSRNIFSDSIIAGTNTVVDNFYNTDINTLFVNQTGNTFEFTDDYNLVNPSVYQGTDATELGIYGGLYPFKVGTLPQNPHVRLKNIATQTAPNGDLNIEIKVGAQDE